MINEPKIYPFGIPRRISNPEDDEYVLYIGRKYGQEAKRIAQADYLAMEKLKSTGLSGKKLIVAYLADWKTNCASPEAKKIFHWLQDMPIFEKFEG